MGLALLSLSILLFHWKLFYDVLNLVSGAYEAEGVLHPYLQKAVTSQTHQYVAGADLEIWRIL